MLKEFAELVKNFLHSVSSLAILVRAQGEIWISAECFKFFSEHPQGSCRTNFSMVPCKGLPMDVHLTKQFEHAILQEDVTAAKTILGTFSKL